MNDRINPKFVRYRLNTMASIRQAMPVGQHYYHHSHRLSDSRLRLGLRGFYDADACSITGGRRLVPSSHLAAGREFCEFAGIDAPDEIPAGGACSHEWIASPLGLTVHREVQP